MFTNGVLLYGGHNRRQRPWLGNFQAGIPASRVQRVNMQIFVFGLPSPLRKTKRRQNNFGNKIFIVVK
jgi:hypothetical protein